LPKRVLVTGGSGFVGANLVRRLKGEGHDVRLLLKPRYNPWRLEGIDPSMIDLVDLADADAVATTVRAARPEWVFHLAAYGAYSSQQSWSAMLASNITGTVNLVDACVDVGIESFINTGSSSEYGLKDHAPGESEVLEPNSNYAVTKAAATLYCGFMARSRGVPIRTLRLYSVYGPWEEPTRLIPTLLLAGLRHRLPPLADPRLARDFIFVDDVCDAFLSVISNTASAPDAVFNVGTGIQSTLEQVVDLSRRLLGIEQEPRWGSMPNRSWDTTTWVADNRKLVDQVGWRPRHSLEAGLRSTIDWFRSDPALRALYEASRELPR
jgi:nucleoside-diphosphate-sugar epimerase